MDLKERLNRLTSISKSQPEEKSQVLGDLRQRLDRLLEPKKAYWKKAVVPIEQLVKGEVISIPEGETFLAKEDFPSDVRCGEMALADVLNIPTYPAHLLSRDERLKELDSRQEEFASLAGMDAIVREVAARALSAQSRGFFGRRDPH